MKAVALSIFSVFAIVLAYFFLSPSEPEATEAPASTLTWKNLDDGIALARSSNKKVLVDVYTDWCGWCKKMDKEVYTDPKVIRILNSKFVVVKLNAESNNQVTFNNTKLSEAEFSRSAGVTGYPATLFLDSNSKPITILPGYVQADRFAHVLSFIGEDHYKTKTFQEYLSKIPSSSR